MAASLYVLFENSSVLVFEVLSRNNVFIVG